MSQALEVPSIVCPNCGHQLSPSITTPSSPVPELLHRNRAATKQEADLVKAKLEEADANLSWLDCDIGRLQVLLASRIQQREHTRQYLVLQKGALSLVHRFPAEILGLIFQEFGSPNTRSAYLPAQVCRFWRDVAFSTPRLWINTLALTLMEGKGQRELHIAQKWLSNSGGLPISFTIGVEHTMIRVSSHPCIKLLATHAHRWMDAEISLPSDQMVALRSVQNNLPRLEHLTIEGHGDAFLQDDIEDLFAAAPRLHSLALRGQRFSDRMVKMPWNQLKICKLVGHYTVAECYDLIQSCHNMTYCELGIDPSAPLGIDVTQRPLLVHRKLTELQILEGAYLGHLLDCLELPAMAKFGHSDVSDFGEDIFIYDHIASLFKRSTPPLHSLHLDHFVRTTHPSLIDCLEQCPLLEELSLTYNSAIGVNAELLSRLTHNPGETACCLTPKLQRFATSIESEFNFEAFTKMVESRWGHHDQEYQAPNHRPIVRIRKATLQRSFSPYVHAEDAISANEENPPWIYLLLQLIRDGFNLVSKEWSGKKCPLEDIAFRIDELDSD